MKSKWKFVIVLLVGLGVLLLSFTALSIFDAVFVAQGTSNPNAHVPPCNPGNSSGCNPLPYVSVILFVVGILVTMAGVIGVVETAFPREKY